MVDASVLDQVRAAAAKRLLFLPHAVRQMSPPGRMISPAELHAAIMAGELIEDYPEDVRGHSCLLLGAGDSGRPVHVVCAPKPGYLAILTAYIPHPDQWSTGFRQRK
ncbi:hypothetical protein SOCEGT47_002580 [Sorangium cellulosum]|uniref:DUF4258 domain-containing protein n=1 Tax=Sorangium cellulosum TaxID=56 RepID=A0A4P2PT46_SORCE|nr:DUF4258 domain-containing protein [Sorangium cellulosum]AUX19805.1 hypothetical protein SOCEGT47_002580 [Sorangium cellulosum]